MSLPSCYSPAALLLPSCYPPATLLLPSCYHPCAQAAACICYHLASLLLPSAAMESGNEPPTASVKRTRHKRKKAEMETQMPPEENVPQENVPEENVPEENVPEEIGTQMPPELDETQLDTQVLGRQHGGEGTQLNEGTQQEDSQGLGLERQATLDFEAAFDELQAMGAFDANEQ
eukprot:16452204-Heterocapsa_arctica.AAC.1